MRLGLEIGAFVKRSRCLGNARSKKLKAMALAGPSMTRRSTYFSLMAMSLRFLQATVGIRVGFPGLGAHIYRCRRLCDASRKELRALPLADAARSLHDQALHLLLAMETSFTDVKQLKD